MTDDVRADLIGQLKTAIEHSGRNWIVAVSIDLLKMILEELERQEPDE